MEFLKRNSSLFLVFFVPFIVYLPTLRGLFYYDDNVIFFGHQVKALADNPFLVFTDRNIHIFPGTPRSLHVFLLMLIYKLFGVSPMPYHLLNLVMHSTVSLLIFVFFRRMLTGYENSEKTALAGSIIFGVHPIHVENITFVTLGGTDLFYTLWIMLSLVCYVRFRDLLAAQKPGLTPYFFLGLSLLTLFFSLLSKESSIIFILIYPLTEIFLKKKGYLWALPHTILIFVFRWGFIKGGAGFIDKAVSYQENGHLGIREVIKNLGFFIKSLVIPYPQSPLIKEFGDERILYGFIVVSVLVLIVSLVRLDKRGLLLYSSAWFFTASIPYLFVPLLTSNVAVTAERYVYASSIGFSIMTAALLSGLLQRTGFRRFFLPAVACLVILYSVLGLAYFSEAWKDEEAFWRHVIKMNPEYVSGYSSLAAIELDKGRVAEAKALLKEGLKKPKGMKPEFSQTAFLLGNITMQEGNLSMAENYYMLSLNYGPYEFSFIELGFIYLQIKDAGKARWAFENALSFHSQNSRALYGLARSYSLLGDRENARRYAGILYDKTRDEGLRALAVEILRQ